MTGQARAPSLLASSRRNTELSLVILAGLLTAGGYVLASLGRGASLPANLIPFLGVILALLATAHLATRRLAPGADGTLVPLAGLLNGIGYVVIARLDPELAGLQAVWTMVGIGAFALTLLAVRKARDLERFRYTFALAGVVLLLLPLVPGIGYSANGARLWIELGTLNFQPGEVAKLCLCVFFAAYLVEKQRLLATARLRIGPIPFPDLKHYGPLVLAWGVSIVVMFWERDLGSSLLFFAVFILMLWVATGRGAYLVIGGILFSGGAYLAWTMFDHVRDRVAIWLDPWSVATGSGFQVVQAAFALAAGGLAGTNLAQGSPDRIPAVTTDFTFAAIGEELGLLGSVAVLTAFLLMVGAGLRIAVRAEGDFEKLLAAGLTVILGLQSFIIIGGVTRLVPLTGITLPFVSYGGSSLVSNYVLLALLLRISDDQSSRSERATATLVEA